MTSRPQQPTESVAPPDQSVEVAWRLLGPAALRFATVLVGPDDAHDVAVTAFLRAIHSAAWASVEVRRAYLIRAVANAAHDYRRQRARRWRRDLAAVLTDACQGLDSQIDVRRQIAKLSVEQRAVIFLTYWEDMTEAAIAELLGVSSGTVHRNLSRARFQLRRTLHD